ncbi:TonB-dependent receptor [Microbulbifer hainanensis]|uniref:TonB-dependent receptor n=1 Tax=Microbulbifer hainanensis TaxID=2735675 RepID=UPI001867FAFB|nr:TonB-dependent receptor [Microbulbifer hainanensis]
MNNNFRKSLLAASVMAASIGLASPSFAASNSSSNIVGSIHADSMDAAASYTVTATNEDTGMTRTIVTDAEKKFRLAHLPIGTYKVVVAKSGVKVAENRVRVSLGSNAIANFDVGTSGLEEVVVEGELPTSVDTYTMDSGLVIGETQIDAMPVARNLTAVSLLAPGVVLGDSDFGSGNTASFASFGGASVAENSCYINGLEVTNTRQGLGCSSVPFEFYKEFQVKTGGYSAEFGRTTGGVINSVTKSGGNTWEFGATMDWSPDALRSEGRVSRGDGGTGAVFRDTSVAETDEMDYTFSASGPIIEDKLFMYALVNPRSKEERFTQATGTQRYNGVDTYRVRESSGGDNLFWGTKIDWDISENHRLSYTGFSDRNESTEKVYAYDAETSTIGDANGGFTRLRGSEANSLNYTGYFGNDLTVSALAGKIKTDYSTDPLNLECPTVGGTLTNGTDVEGCGPGGSIGDNFDENTQYRLDVSYALGDHALKAGMDVQQRASTRVSVPVGGHSWEYLSLENGGDVQGDSGALFVNTSGAPMDIVQDRIFVGGGSFSSDLTAFYLEDQWQVNDQWMVSVGLRKDQFEGEGTTGKQLFDFDTDIAPRLGFTWDFMGDGVSKVYGTWGRYYLPMANNTIYRAASGVSDTTTFYTFDGIDPATGIPTGIDPVNGTVANSSYTSSVSAIPEKDIFQAQEADPFARDEFILGFETAVNDNLLVGVRGIYREVTSALDDYCGIYAYPYCVMVNPGETSSWYKDAFYWNGTSLTVLDADGNAVNVGQDIGAAFGIANFDGAPDPGSLTTHSAATIGLPEAKNEYRAIQTELTYSDEKMNWKFIYTWSRSTGNFEGAVKSDIDQADAGITQDFDFPALMDGAQGYQANDRRHVFKFFGSYDFTEDLSFGMNATLASGRPLSAFGKAYPSNNPNVYGSYGDTFYHLESWTDANGNEEIDPGEAEYSYHPRGDVGRTPWTISVDASARYNFAYAGVDMVASLDVFNLLDSQESLSTNEHYERSAGKLNQYYGAAYSWQAPRSVRLGLQANF